MTRRRLRAGRSAVVAAAIGAMVLPTAAAAQGPTPGGQNGWDAQSTKSADAPGVPLPEEVWTTVLEDRAQVGGDEYEAVFDSEGHVLFQGKNQAADPDPDVLIAVDWETGEVAWELAGVSASCGVAASDDGLIYGMTEVTGEDEVLAIDAATGTVVDSVRHSEHGSPMTTSCRESLRLAPDGTLVSMIDMGFSMHMLAFETDGGLSHAWTRHYHVSGSGADGESTSWLGRPVIAADGASLYHCLQITEEERPNDADDLGVLEKIDLDSGAVIDSQPLQENAGCHLRGVVAVDGGVVVATDGHQPGYTMNFVRDTGSQLQPVWSTRYSRDDDEDESGIGNYPAASLSLSGDTIVFRGAGGGIHTGVDVATGEVQWQYRASSFGAGEENAAVDAQGNLYITTFGGAMLESFSGDGHPRFSAETGDILDDNTGFATKFITVAPDGGVLLRGTVAGDDQALIRIGTAPSQRLAGVSRFDTAAQLALGNFGPGLDTVYLATGTNFPDALTAGPLAALGDAPVLLAAPTLLPQETASALRDLQPRNVVAIGGEAAISNEVLAEAAEDAGGAATDRIFGANRFGTAAAIAHRLPASDVVYIGTGANYPDALAGGPATDGAPILLATSDLLPQETIASLADRKPKRVVALGGQAAISNAVLDQAAQAAGGATTGRLQGPDRFTTALDIADEVVAGGGFTGTVYVAVGTNYPDAVAAAPAAEAAGAPIVLVAPDFIPEEVEVWLKGLDGLEHVVILGGDAAIGGDVEARLAALAS